MRSTARPATIGLGSSSFVSSTIRALTLSSFTSVHCLTLAIRSRSISSSFDETRPPGFAMKSTAPNSRALKTLRSLALDETTMTGVGLFAISQRRKAKPSSSGISRSSVMTSGLCLTTCLIPSSPFTAVATTRMSPCFSRSLEIVTRLYAESSMTMALIKCRGPLLPSLLVDHVVPQMLQLELARERNQRFGVAQQQVPSLVQPPVEVPDHDFLRRVVEVDDDVPAE